MLRAQMRDHNFSAANVCMLIDDAGQRSWAASNRVRRGFNDADIGAPFGGRWIEYFAQLRQTGAEKLQLWEYFSIRIPDVALGVCPMVA